MTLLAAESPDWFTRWLLAQPVWMLWALCGAGIAALAVGADRTVDAAVRLARSLGMSKVIIGATVVSIGTTTPEMFTSVTAAFRGYSGLALGNGVGSIICDTGLIFGCCCLLSRLPLNRFVLRRHGWLQFGSGALLAAICGLLAAFSGRLGAFGTEEAVGHTWNAIPRWVGLMLVGLLGGYLFVSVRWARRRPDILAGQVPAVETRPAGAAAAVKSLVVLVVGLAVVAAGSNLLIPSVSVLATEHYRIPSDVLAVTLVAFGTSLPEAVTAVAAVVKGHKELMVGNIVGADILNVLFVVGASACATKLKVPPTFYVLHLPVMLAVLLLLRAYIFAGGTHFRRWQGAPLLAIYVGYVVALVKFAPHLAGH